MNDEQGEYFFCFLSILCPTILLMGLFLFGHFLGWSDGIYQQKNKAIEAGVAEYVVDSKTGETTFQYKVAQ